MYRALLFDLDGTLAETNSLHLPTWVDVLRPYGIEVDEEFYREKIAGCSNSRIVEDLPTAPASAYPELTKDTPAWYAGTRARVEARAAFEQSEELRDSLERFPRCVAR